MVPKTPVDPVDSDEGTCILDLDLIYDYTSIYQYYPPSDTVSTTHSNRKQYMNNAWIVTLNYANVNYDPNDLTQIYGIQNITDYEPSGFLFEFITEANAKGCSYRFLPFDVAEILSELPFLVENPQAKYAYKIANIQHCILCEQSKKYGTVCHPFARASYHIDCFRQFQSYLCSLFEDYSTEIRFHKRSQVALII